MKLYQLYLVYEINTLEQMTTKFVKEEGIEEVVIGNVVIMLFLYTVHKWNVLPTDYRWQREHIMQ